MQTSNADNSIVLITGASSGIGKACALHLDRAGFLVIAAARKQADAEALHQQASERLKTVLLDVADSASIEAAAAEVAAMSRSRLFGLINNAGIALGGPLEMLSNQDIRRVIEVNTIGVLAVTRAFLPMLRRGRGRIINMGSTSGILALPCLSAYAASKFALKGLSDALRTELRPVGVLVTLLEIGNVETPIWEKGIDASEKNLAAAGQDICQLYAPLVKFSRHIAIKSPKIAAESVARVVEKALRSKRPKPCYPVGIDARLIRLAACLPRRMRDWLVLRSLPR
jgi:NAD(P)-dependent dehydrogenase (short-subunit alcohol dehydrogenase family)